VKEDEEIEKIASEELRNPTFLQRR